MARRTWSSLFRSLFGGISGNQTKQAQRANLLLEQMEDRTTPANFTFGGGILSIDLNITNGAGSNNEEIILTSTSNGGDYLFTLNGSNVFFGSDQSGLTGTGTNTLTITNALSLTDVNLADVGGLTGAAVTFDNSNGFSYVDNFNVGLFNTPGAATVTSTTTFNSSTLTVFNAGSIAINAPLSATGQTIGLTTTFGAITGSGLVTAATADLNANTGITANLSAATITADSTNGNISIDNAIAADINSLTTGTGNIVFNNTGNASFGTVSTTDGSVDLEAISGDLTVATSVTAGGAKDLFLTATTSGNIVITGNVNAAGNVVTATSAGNISGAGLVTAATADLNAVTGITANLSAATITADSTNGNISIDNAIAATVNSLTTGTGDIVFNNAAGDVLFSTVTATKGSVSLDTLGGRLVTNSPVFAGGTGNDISLTSDTQIVVVNSLQAADAITVTSGGALDITSTGGLFAGGDVTLMSGVQRITIAGDIVTNGGLVNFKSATTISANVSIITTGGGATGGSVQFDSTVTGVNNATNSLGITAGSTGNVSFGGNFNGDSIKTSLNIISANNVTTAFAINANALTVGGGVNSFSSTGTGGTITNAVAFGNTGTLTLGQAGGTQTFIGGVNTTSVGGLVTLNGTIATTDSAIGLGAVTLGSNTTLDANDNSGNGDVVLGAVTGTGFSLTLDGNDVTGTSVSGVSALTLQNVTGTGSFNGAVDATSLSVGATVNNFSSTGSGGTITNAVTFSNTGTLALGQAGGTQTYFSGLTATAPSSVKLAGTIGTSNTPIMLGDIGTGVNLIADTVVNAGGADITFGGTIGGGFALSANSMGSTTFEGAVGGQALASLSTNASGTTKINGGAITTTGNQTFNDNVALGAATQFTTTSSGTITFNGSVSTSGNTVTFNANGSGDVVANTSTNDFGTVEITDANNVSLTDGNGIAFNTSAIRGNLDINAGGVAGSGLITQNGALNVGGDTSILTPDNVTLDNPGNIFTGTVGITASNVNTVKITDSTALQFATSTGIGNLLATSSGAISQVGKLEVAFAAEFEAGSGNDITLNNPGNDFATVKIISGKDVTLTDANALAFDASSISGALNLTTSGTITQNAPLSVAGPATFAAGVGNDITLNENTNDFSAVTVTSGGNLTLTEGSGFNIGGISGIGNGALSVSGLGTITASGGITTSGTILFQGLTSGTSIGIAGAAGQVQYASSVFTNLTNGASSISIGNAVQSGAVIVNAVSFSDPVSILSTGNSGTITVNGTITGTGNATVNLSASPNTIFLNSDIVTAGQAITLDNGSGGDTAIVLGANASLDTTSSNAFPAGANVTLRGPVDSDSTARSLNLNGGASGSVLVTNTIGGTSGLSSLTINGSNVDLANIGDVDTLGVTGGTTVNATGVTFNGTTYKTDGFQSYTATNLNAAATSGTTAFSTTADNLNFFTLNQLTLNGADFTANTQGVGQIGLAGGIDGSNSVTPVETATLTTTGSINLGLVTDLKALNANATTLSLRNNISNTTDVAIVANVVLENNITIQTGNDISITGTIDSDNVTSRSLALNAGPVGDILVTGAVGSLALLNAVTIVNANTATFNSSINVIDMMVLDATTGVTVQGNLTAFFLSTAATSNTYDFVLNGSNNSVTGPGTVLSNTGTVVLGNDATDVFLFTDGINVVDVSPTDSTSIAGFIRTAGKAIHLDQVNLTANATVDATNNGSSLTGATISLTNGVVLNGFVLTTLGGSTGSTDVTGTVPVNNGELIAESGNLNIGTGATTATVTLTAQNTLIQAKAGALTVNAGSSITGGASNNVVLQSDNIFINSGTGSITTGGTVTVAPVTLSRNIYLGSAASTPLPGLKINQSGIDAIDTSLLIFGQNGGSGAVTVGITNVNDLLQIVANGGGAKVFVTGALTSTVKSAPITGIEIDGSGSTTVISAPIVTAGTDVLIDDAVQIDAASVLIDTTNGGTVTPGANVTITGGTNGIFATKGASNSLVITAGQNGLVDLGALNGFGTGGTGSLVNDLTVTGLQINLPNTTNLAGAASLTADPTGASIINVGAALTTGTTLSLNSASINLDADLTAGTSLALTGAVTLTNSVVLSGDGITVTGTINADNNDLTLDGKSGSSTVGAVSVTGAITNAANINIQDATGVTLSKVTAQTIQLSNTLTGAVSFNDDLTVAGQLSAAAASYSVAIVGPNNTIGGPVSFLNTGALTIGNDDSDVTVISSGASRPLQTLLQGSVTFGGVTSLGLVSATNSGGNLTLGADTLELGYNNAGDAFGTLVINTVNSFTASAGALASATLAINAGSIGQTAGTLAPVGTANLTATGTINLAGANNLGGDVTFTGTNVTINDITALTLAGASSATGNLVLSSTGGISQTAGSVKVTGSTALNATGAAISLNQATNAFTGPVAFDGSNVALTATGAINLATSTATGTLDVNATGAISQSGALAVTGKSTFSGTNISLNAANSFANDVKFTGNNVVLNDANADLNITTGSSATGNLNVTSAGALTDEGTITVGGNAAFAAVSALLDGLAVAGTVAVSTSGNATLVNATKLALAASTVGGNLAATATTGDLTDSGAVNVNGNAVFTTSATNATITLDQAAVAGTVQLNTTGATANASYTSASAVTLNGSTVGGSLLLSTPGDISQTAAVVIGGSSTLNGAVINLTNPANDFVGAVGFTGSNVSLRDSNSLSVGGSATGTLTLNAVSLTQSAVLTVVGATNLTTTADTVFGNISNTFTGPITVSTGTDAKLRAQNALNFNNSTIGGNLVVNSIGVDQVIGSTIAVTGTTDIDVTSTGNITLDNAGTNLGGAFSFNALNVTLVDTNSILLGNGTAAGVLDLKAATAISQSGGTALQVAGDTHLLATGDITVGNPTNTFGGTVDFKGANVSVADSSPLVLAASSASGTLTLASGGSITQIGTITAGNTTAAGNDITLTDAGNDFASFGALSGNNVNINDINTLSLTTSNITGTLNVTTNGAITNSGALIVGGAATLTAGSSNNITLNDAGNDFASVGIISGNNVVINDINALVLDASTISGTLNVTTNGAITDNGALLVTGAATFAAGSANDITLNNANDFSSVGITSGKNVVINDINALALDASTISGTLDVTTNGAITDNGALQVTGAATFTAGSANDITLNNANDFASVGITSGKNVVINDINALILNASTISGTLGVTTNGAISNSGGLVVTGASTFAAGSGNDITLNVANDFSSVGITSGKNVTIYDINALALNAITISGDLDIYASINGNGVITQNGALAIGGDTTIKTNDNVTLENSANIFTGSFGVTALNPNTVKVVDSTPLDLSASTMVGNLIATSKGAITQSGILDVLFRSEFKAGTGSDITLNNLNNTLASGVSFDGANVTINNSVDLNIEGTAAGNLDINTAGKLTDISAVNVSNNATFQVSGTGNTIDLDSLAVIGFITVNTMDGNATIVNANDINFSGNVMGIFTITALAGGISDVGPLNAQNGLVLAAPGFSTITQDLLGTGGLVFNGTGTLTLDGDNSFSGNTILTAGILVLNGSLGNSNVQVTGGMMRGSGPVASLTSTGGTVRPGQSPGVFDSAGNVSLGKGSSYIVELDGTTPGTGYSQVIGTNITLGSTLALTTSTGFNPQVGERFTIVFNNGTNRVNGTFAGLPENATVSLGVLRFHITYKGGPDGNNVVLTAINNVPTPPGPIVTAPFSLAPGSVVTSIGGGVVEITTQNGRVQQIVPFAGYTGLLSVNAIDRTGEGIADGLLVAVASPGAAPHIMVIDAATGRSALSFFAFDPGFLGGLSVSSGLSAIGATNTAVIVAGAGAGAQPSVSVFNAVTGRFINQFYAFAPEYNGGVNVAMSNPDSTGQSIVVVGAKTVAHVVAFDLNQTNRPVASFLAFGANIIGANVSVGDLDSDGTNNIVVGAGAGGAPSVAIYTSRGQKEVEFLAYAPGFRGGVNVGLTDFDKDGLLEVATGSAGGAPGTLFIFDNPTDVIFSAFQTSFATNLMIGTNLTLEVQQPA